MLEVVIIGGLVTWRITNILSKQRGPLDVFMRLRSHLAKTQQRSGGLYDFITCPTCLSMPIAALTAILPAQDVFQFIAYTLSFSAITSIVERLTSSERVNKS